MLIAAGHAPLPFGALLLVTALPPTHWGGDILLVAALLPIGGFLFYVDHRTPPFRRPPVGHRPPTLPIGALQPSC